MNDLAPEFTRRKKKKSQRKNEKNRTPLTNLLWEMSQRDGPFRGKAQGRVYRSPLVSLPCSTLTPKYIWIRAGGLPHTAGEVAPGLWSAAHVICRTVDGHVDVCLTDDIHTWAISKGVFMGTDCPSKSTYYRSDYSQVLGAATGGESATVRPIYDEQNIMLNENFRLLIYISSLFIVMNDSNSLVIW